VTRPPTLAPTPTPTTAAPADPGVSVVDHWVAPPARSGRRLDAERVVLRLARPYLGRLLGAGLLATGTELAALALMATATWLLITAAGQPPLDAITVAIVSVRALAIGRGLLRYTERLAGHDATLRVVTDLRTQVFAALAARRPEPGDHSGDRLSRLICDVEAVQGLLLRVLVPGAAAAAVATVAIAGTAMVSPPAALALAGGLFVAGVALPLATTMLTRRTADRVAPSRGALTADAIDLTQGAADLAAFGATGSALTAAGRRVRELARLERRLAVTGWAIDGAGVLVAGATTAGVVLAAMRTDASGVLVGVLAVGTLAAMEITLALVTSARQWTELRGGLCRVSGLLASAPPPDRPDQGTLQEPVRRPSPDGPDQGPPSGGLNHATVELADVTLRYRPDATPALDRIGLLIPAGRRIAVVGPSGAGKSSLLGVLTGAVPPASGRVSVAGQDPARLPEHLRHRLVGGLLPEAYVFHASVRDNLLLGRPWATEEELVGAADAAGLLDWVGQQPDRWDTMVGADGGHLSGGQRQRLALARALLAAPTVLVLDEPTEGLDPAAADQVLRNVLAGAGHSTVVLVTHQLLGLGELDEIVVLDNGRIVQRGRHAELVAVPGWYRDQWRMQQAAERGYLTVAR